jgi:hypothetical protein
MLLDPTPTPPTISSLLARRQAGRVWLVGQHGPALGRRHGSGAADAQGPLALELRLLSSLLARRQAAAYSTCVK